MKIFNAIGNGFLRSAKAWKGVLIVWFFSLLMVSLIALPMKGAMKAAFGKSMITDKLLGGLDVEVLSDLGANLRSLIHFFSSGLFLLLIIGILVYAFFAGGLFNSLRKTDQPFSTSEFFKASAGNFWSFLGISLIISTILGFIGFLVVGLPVSIVSQIESGAEGTPYKVALLSIIVFLIIEAIFFLVADYARAWQVTNEKKSCFKAVGSGFSLTFRTFFSSIGMMLIIVLLQLFFSFLVIKIIGPWKPDSGGSVFLLFLISQLMFFIRVLLRTWRYGSVTSLMELNNPANSLISENVTN